MNSTCRTSRTKGSCNDRMRLFTKTLICTLLHNLAYSVVEATNIHLHARPRCARQKHYSCITIASDDCCTNQGNSNAPSEFASALFTNNPSSAIDSVWTENDSGVVCGTVNESGVANSCVTESSSLQVLDGAAWADCLGICNKDNYIYDTVATSKNECKCKSKKKTSSGATKYILLAFVAYAVVTSKRSDVESTSFGGHTYNITGYSTTEKPNDTARIEIVMKGKIVKPNALYVGDKAYKLDGSELAQRLEQVVSSLSEAVVENNLAAPHLVDFESLRWPEHDGDNGTA